MHRIAILALSGHLRSSYSHCASDMDRHTGQEEERREIRDVVVVLVLG